VTAPTRPTAVSALDVAPVWHGTDATAALHATLDLAPRLEALGYARYWVAEHHNTPSLATAVPPIWIALIAGRTKTLRVGSGAVLLPNHSPLVVAEQFGSLAAAFPDRIDLGIGRAPGTDQPTARALRRSNAQQDGPGFEQALDELRGYFDRPNGSNPDGRVMAAVAAEQAVPVWLLGSSPASAQLAGLLGLRYAFAHQINPYGAAEALRRYRAAFRPSAALPEPYALVSALVVAGECDEEAKRLALPYLLGKIQLRTGPFPDRFACFPDRRKSEERQYTATESGYLADVHAQQLIGGPETIRRRTAELIAATGANELMAMTLIPEQEARVRSYELLAHAVSSLPGIPAAESPARVGTSAASVAL
jgi:luciferase family oxidoreductase group 1